MITDLSSTIVKKINETSLDSLKVVLQGIQSELGDSQKKNSWQSAYRHD